MTIQELYDWAKENNLTNAEIYAKNQSDVHTLLTTRRLTVGSPDTLFPEIIIED